MNETLVTPRPGQSLGGLLMEGAAALGERTVRGLLAEAGMTIVDLLHHAASPEQLAVLADALDLPSDALASRQHPLLPGEGRRRSFFDVSVDDRLLEKRTRRFAPASLADEPWHKASWQLRALPFCERSWTLLTDACHSCGTVQRWSRAWGPELCDACAVPLGEGSTPAVPEDLHASLRLAAGLAHHDAARRAESMAALPDGLRRLGAGGCVDVLCAVAPVVDPSIRGRHHQHLPAGNADPARIVVAVARAWDLIADWPGGLLAECDVRMARRTGRHGDGNAGATTALMSIGQRQAASAPLVRAVADLRAIVSERQSSYIGTWEFAQRAGVGVRAVTTFRRMGRIPSVLGFSKRDAPIPMLLASEADRGRREVVGAMYAENAASLLGCTYRAVEELVELGVLIRSPFLVSKRRIDHMRIEAAGLQALVDAVTDRAAAEGDGLDLPLARAMWAVGGRLKPWSRVLEALRDGELRFAMRPGSGPFASRIMIRSDDVATLLKLRSDFADDDERFAACMTRKDAFAVLNTEARRSPDLLSDWPSPSGTNRVVPTIDLLRLAGRHVTCRELAWRNGTTPSAIGRELARLGVPADRHGTFNRPRAVSRLGGFPRRRSTGEAAGA